MMGKWFQIILLGILMWSMTTDGYSINYNQLQFPVVKQEVNFKDWSLINMRGVPIEGNNLGGIDISLFGDVGSKIVVCNNQLLSGDWPYPEQHLWQCYMAAKSKDKIMSLVLVNDDEISYKTITIGYTVPEPATICIFGFGALILIRKHRIG